MGTTVGTQPAVERVWNNDNTSSPDRVRPADGYIDTGYPTGNLRPNRANRNWLDNFLSNAVRYFARRGIVDWKSDETYQASDVVQDNDGAVYQLAGTATVGTRPAADRKNWGRLAARSRWGYRVDRRVYALQNFLSGEAVDNVSPYFQTLSPGRWRLLSAVTTGRATIECGLFSTVSVLQPLAKVTTSLGANDHALLVLDDIPARFNADNVIALDFSAALAVVGSNGCDIAMGLAGSDPYVAPLTNYALISKPAGNTNWFAQNSDAGSASSAVDLGVAPTANTLQRFRVEWIGANRSPTSAGQVRFYVNGVLKTTITTNLPVTAGTPTCKLMIGLINNTTATRIMYVGEVSLETNTWAGDLWV